MGKESVLKRGGVEALALALLIAKPNGAELYFSEKVGLPGLRPAHVQQLSDEPNIRVLDHNADMFFSLHFLMLVCGMAKEPPFLWLSCCWALADTLKAARQQWSRDMRQDFGTHPCQC